MQTMRLGFSTIIFCFLFSIKLHAQTGSINGTITNSNNLPLDGVTVVLENSKYGTTTNAKGYYEIKEIKSGEYLLQISAVQIRDWQQNIKIIPGTNLVADFSIEERKATLEQIEVFGTINKAPDKFDALTRLPLQPKDQIQSVTIISDKLINQQGVLSITDAVKNAPGVYPYSSYGGTRESIGSRGFRGIPILLNGVRVHSDFRGQGFIFDMQGVDNIQILKGASAITQGFGNDLGSAGGVINIVTKTPKLYNAGDVGLRFGSWGHIRPVFDINRVLVKDKSLAVRVNGAFDRMDGYRVYTGKSRFFINPSIEWRPTATTKIILEANYLKDRRVSDPGTVSTSLTSDSYIDLPKKTFLGFKENIYNTSNLNLSARVKQDISRNVYLNFASYYTISKTDNNSIALTQFINKKTGLFVRPANIVSRSIFSGDRDDRNQVFQVDFVAKDLHTGRFKHLVQAGADYRTLKVTSTNFNTITIDTINVLSDDIRNSIILPVFAKSNSGKESFSAFGVLAQYVIEYDKLVRLFLSGRYSGYSTNSATTIYKATTQLREAGENGQTFNPMAGVMIMPAPWVNLFASYANTTNPRSASYMDKYGNKLGNETIHQYETGAKTEFFEQRLRMNLTFYRVNNNNMIMQAIGSDANGVIKYESYYFKGGSDIRQGIELEVLGRPIPNLDVAAGISLIDAKFKHSTVFVDGSRPNNTPAFTGNISAHYMFTKGMLQNFSIGANAFYIGERPYNDHTKIFADFHGIVPGLAPYNNRACSIVNLRLGYNYKNMDLQLLANNLFNTFGYDAYRNVYVDRIDPINFGARVNYRF